MQISNIQNNFNSENHKEVSYKGFNGRKFIRAIGNSDSLTATIILEAFVTGGRGINAYKRGGKDELRESIFDNVVSAIVWMKGVDIFNSAGDEFGKKVLKLPTTEFDVGRDALRNPFKNLTESLGGEKKAKSLIRKLAIFKFTKIILATLSSTAVIGYIMPRINQALTKRIMMEKKMQQQMDMNNPKTDKNKKYDSIQFFSMDDFNKQIENRKTVSFKGSFIDTTTQITHALENHTICKMLTNDAGIITGRAISARNEDEGIEYVFRDISSLFFYFPCMPMIYYLLQHITKSKGLTEIDPVAAKSLNNEMIKQLKNKDGSTFSMNVEEFKKKTLGEISKEDKQLLEKLPFKSDVISLNELSKHIKDEEILKRAEKMAQLQPEIAGIGKLLTKQQVYDVFKNGALLNAEFMKGLYKERFGDKIFDKLRFISMGKITEFRDNIDKYVLSVIDKANKENNGIIDVKTLEKINVKSFKLSALFRTVAMLVSALSLAFLIPQLQYAITRYRTGSNEAPMFRDYK